MTKDNKLTTIFAQISDYRSHINRLHNLNDILLIGITAVISGAETWEQIEYYAKSKEEFLRTFLELPHGIPSDDTINRMFTAIDSEEFESCFIKWVNTRSILVKRQVIAIDGKSIRGAKSHGKKSPIHMVSAWACENNLVLGQVKVSDKSNEITAIPELLDLLSVESSVITIDAMGCQKEIAKKIIAKKADYILAVKGNQASLLEGIKDEFLFSKTIETNTTVDADHGRIETRKCEIITQFKESDIVNHWKNLETIIRIESEREFKNSTKSTERSTRYYISSLKSEAKDFGKAIRSHWAIENKLHWTLDVAFREDDSRKRKGNASQNYSIILKIALNLLKNEKSKKLSVKSKRLRAAWDNQYLLKVLEVKV
jgi:predicted transposase YbfD/YdcC